MHALTFEIGKDLMGIDLGCVYRILENVPVIPVCFAPPAYLGLIAYRGEIFDAVDPAVSLQTSSADPNGDRRFILLRWSGHHLALAVGKIDGLLRMPDKETASPRFLKSRRPVNLLTPEQIWRRMRELPYGPD
jgi:chemotaxis signal transduction protein